MTALPAPEVWPGAPAPLGVRWDGEGVNVALLSGGSSAVEVCLFDEAGNETRLPLTESTHHVWHGYLPQVGPGQRYGFRVDGPYDPARGARWNPRKLLVDPYARALEGSLRLHPAVFGEHAGDGDNRDSAPFVPRSVVVNDAHAWGDDRPPATPWADTVIYELHIKGFTAGHPDLPPALRGSYAGLAHPATVAYLVDLGVTAVELLPVHHFVSEPHLLRRGLTNYWGYNTLGYFAPHAAYSASGNGGEQVTEFKAMVQALHSAGIEVLLDVVYNHTAESGHDGPTLSFRGVDNAAWYRLQERDPTRYRDYTGCGNTLDARRPNVVRLVLDSLRYWVSEMHVDGFRFDLASTLGRAPSDEVDMLAPLFSLIAQDPVLSHVKLIAEPWDLGAGGYQVGRFPPPWGEWNGRYRDGVREHWLGRHRGEPAGVRELGFRLSGSSDLYQHDGRRPWASVNFVTSHDGFTLRDLTTYERKRNDDNGEGGRDGDNDGRGWNCGVEGESADPDVQAVRRRQARNLLTTLLVSAGVPMLAAGDELRRTQGGNNNAYCQDSPVSWLDWDLDDEARAMLAFVRRLVALRRRSPVLRQGTFFTGVRDESGVSDLAWFRPDGAPMTDADWADSSRETLSAYLSGETIRTRGPRGEQVRDASYLVVTHAGRAPVSVCLPGPPWASAYDVMIDTLDDSVQPAERRLLAGEDLKVAALSLLLLRAVPATPA